MGFEVLGISPDDLGRDLVGEIAWTMLCLQAVGCSDKEAAIALLRHEAQDAIATVRAATPPGVGMLVATQFRMMCGFEDGQPFFDLLFPLHGGDLVIRLGLPESTALHRAIAAAHDQMKRQPEYRPENLPTVTAKMTGVTLDDNGIPQTAVDLSEG